MAPLAPSSTPRFKVFYTNCGHTHTLQIRSHASPSVVGTLIGALFGALGNNIYATTIDEVQFAADNSNVFNPVVTGAEGDTYGTGTGNDGVAPQYVDFIGRTTGGRRVRIAIFGMAVLGADYRFQPGEVDGVDDAIAVLVAAGSTIVAIDDLTPVWKSYANAGNNAYWQRAVRN